MWTEATRAFWHRTAERLEDCMETESMLEEGPIGSESIDNERLTASDQAAIGKVRDSVIKYAAYLHNKE